MMQSKAIRSFTDSAAALLAAAGVALFISNGAGAGFVPPRDPLLGVPMPVTFWIAGAVALGMGVICLFSQKAWLKLTLVLWFALNFCVYQLGLFWLAGPRSFNGYWGALADTFGISLLSVNLIQKILSLYLLAGSSALIMSSWLQKPALEDGRNLKMPCPACGGHVEFSMERLGQTIACPHCSVPVTLRKPNETLKMSCFFCKEHIEFPAHALGQKIKCPHCKWEIGLRQETV